MRASLFWAVFKSVIPTQRGDQIFKMNFREVNWCDAEISNYIEKYINDKIVKIIHPKNLHDLLLVIENINFGIFMDSGPLHVAKILNKKGVLITSSVGKEKLLSDFNNIKSIDNSFKEIFK